MLTYNKLIELRKKLADEEMTIDIAKELYWSDFKKGKRAWQTKDWKERRAKVIKEKCEICASKDKLTIQHLSHPNKYSDFERQLTKKRAQLQIDTNSFVERSVFKQHLIENFEYLPIPLCPKCGNRNPNNRMRKTPQYLCTRCRHEFDEPTHKITIDELVDKFYNGEETIDVRDKCFISRDKWKNKQNLSEIKYWLLREIAKNKNSENIQKEAFLSYFDDNINYLSFEDTITTCNKCAFNFDIKNMDLCPKCNLCYKGVQYESCIQCLPEEKRKQATDNIDFGKEMQEMHNRLGID